MKHCYLHVTIGQLASFIDQTRDAPSSEEIYEGFDIGALVDVVPIITGSLDEDGRRLQRPPKPRPRLVFALQAGVYISICSQAAISVFIARAVWDSSTTVVKVLLVLLLPLLLPTITFAFGLFNKKVALYAMGSGN